MFGFGRKKSVDKKPGESSPTSSSAGSKTPPKPMTAFERRQSLTQKYEQEKSTKGKAGAKDDDDDVPPPPPEDGEDDDFVPPPPPPPSSNLPPKAPRTPPLVAPSSPANGAQKHASSERQRAATKPNLGADDDESGGGGGSRGLVDSDYVEFTIVPVLLRGRFDYDEANKFGNSVKKMSEAEAKLMMANANSLCAAVQKSGVKLPNNWEKAIHDDMIWVKGGGGPGSRKSFVYYAPTPAQGERPRSNGSESSADPVARTRAQTRQRASFSSGPQMIPASADEGDANRYKAPTRSVQSESISKDLADLVATLGQLEAGKKPAVPNF